MAKPRLHRLPVAERHFLFQHRTTPTVIGRSLFIACCAAGLGCAELDLGMEEYLTDGDSDGKSSDTQRRVREEETETASNTDAAGRDSDKKPSRDSDTDTGGAGGYETDTGDADTLDNLLDNIGAECTAETAVEICGAAKRCVDGVCCDSPCAGTCMACNLSGHKGECIAHPAGEDPDGECGVCEVCNGDETDSKCVAAAIQTDLKRECGTCGMCNGDAAAPACIPVPKGEDPLDACESSDTASCGTIGVCDGVGGCQVYDQTSACGAIVCEEGMLSIPLCDGTGACGETSVSCNGYVCKSAAVCMDICSDDNDCMEGFHCEDEACVVEKPLQIGAPCSTGASCESENCVDGVCCDSACDGDCESCTLTGVEGVCTAIPDGEDDPDRTCSDGVFCNGEEHCSAGACVSAGNPCNEGDDDLCNDCNETSDSCTQPEGTICDAAAADDCRSSSKCNNQGECVVDSLPDGTLCTADDNICTDDICRDGKCEHVPIDNAECGDLRVLMKWNGSALTSNCLYPYIKLSNIGDAPISTEGLKIVYWFTWDDSTRLPTNQVADCLYLGLDMSGTDYCSASEMSLTPLTGNAAKPNADYMWIITLNTGTYIPAGFTTNHWEIRVRMAGDDWGVTYDLSDDYSFSLNDDFYETDTIAVYRNSDLIWGKEP